MLSEYLKGIEGMTAYPLISLVIVVPVFFIILIVVLRMRKDHLEKMSRLPLD